jgi:hypothetical protein
MNTPLEPKDEASLREALRLARRELKLARGRQEIAEEAIQRVRRQRAALRRQVRASTDALARLLSERYWADQPSALTRRLRPGGDAAAVERAQVAAVEASDLFDGGWYLRHQPAAVRDLVSPALHYVRVTDYSAEPGPDFDTQSYLEDHPEARRSNLPALLHYLGHDPRARG